MKKGTLAVVAIIAVIALVVVLVLALVPFPMNMSGQVSTSDCPSCTSGASNYFGYVEVNIPAGSSVNINWQDTSGNLVSFTMFPENFENDVAGSSCSDTGLTGTCSFTAAAGGTYTISLEDSTNSQGTQTATYSGTYTATYL